MYYYRDMARLTLLCLCVTLTLSGCLDSETSIELERDGSGTITLSYTIDSIAWDTGAVGGEQAGRIVPVTRRDFERTAAQIEGLRLRRYRSQESEQRVEISAVLQFANTDALERFLGPDSVEVQLNESGGRWSQIIAVAREQDDDDLALARSLEPYSLVLRLDPPSAVRQVSRGEITPDGRIAGLELGLEEIVLATQAIVWTVEW